MTHPPASPSANHDRQQRRRIRESIASPRPVGRDEFRGSSRYELLIKIASGGSAAVYIGRATASAGFSRIVAVKRAHPHLAHDPAVERMMTTEARLASGLNHANVVAVQDVEHIDKELLLILDYVEGASLAELLEAGAAAGCELPSRVAIRIALDACAGLAAVHEIEGKDGRPVGFLHRDVSPQNILVGIDGTSRITDFGLAKHICSDNTKATGMLQGKLAYLAPEVVDNAVFSVGSDIFAMGVVVWEALAKRRLFQGDSWADTVRKVGLYEAPPLSSIVPSLDQRLDRVVARALDKVATRRYATVREFASALEEIALRHNLVATSSEVTRYVQSVLGDSLRRRRELIRSFQGNDVGEDLLTTQTITVIPRAAMAMQPSAAPQSIPSYGAPQPQPLPAAGYGWQPAPELPFGTPNPALTPTGPISREPMELSADDFEIEEDEDDNASTLSRGFAPRASYPKRTPGQVAYEAAKRANTLPLTPSAPAARPTPVVVVPLSVGLGAPPPAAPCTPLPSAHRTPIPHTSGSMLRPPPRIELRDHRPAPPDADSVRDRSLAPLGRAVDEDNLRTVARNDRAPQSWSDPLAPWVPPSVPPPDYRPDSRLRRAAAAFVSLSAAGAMAALIAAYTMDPTAQAAPPAAQGQQSIANVRPVAANPSPVPSPPAKAKAAPSTPAPGKAAPAKPAPAARTLTPDSLPDARPGARKGALTPDALPDARPGEKRTPLTPDALPDATPRPSAPAVQSGRRKTRRNPYRR